MTSTGSSEDT
jgi:hypothetical protein